MLLMVFHKAAYLAHSSSSLSTEYDIIISIVSFF